MNRSEKSRIIVFYKILLKDESTESKINEFDFDFVENLKIEHR